MSWVYIYIYLHIYIYILQPGRGLFTNHTKKNNNKSCVVRLPVSLRPQQRSQTETNGVGRQAASSLVSQPSVCPSVPRGQPACRRTRSASGRLCELTASRLGADKCPRPKAEPALLDSVLVKPAETLRKVPAQADGEDVHEDEQSEGVEQRHRVL